MCYIVRLFIPTAILVASSFIDLSPSATAVDAEPKPAAKKAASLDDELFQDLDLGKPAADKRDGEKRPAKPTEPEPPIMKPSKSADATKPSSGGDVRRPENQPAAKRSEIDEELLRHLGGDESRPQQNPPQQGPARGGPDRSEDDAADNPLVRLSRQIRDAERRLRDADSGDQTQEMQRKIVDDLEKLIAQIEQQQQQQSQSKSKKPGAPKQGARQQPKQPKPGDGKPGRPNDNPTDSNEQLTDRKNEKPQTGKLKEMLEKVWGELPERQRQDVMQASFDDFPAKYQYVIEEYFKTLIKRQD